MISPRRDGNRKFLGPQELVAGPASRNRYPGFPSYRRAHRSDFHSRSSIIAPRHVPHESGLKVFGAVFRKVLRLVFTAPSYNGFVNLDPPFDRITIDPEQMNGQPCIRNMRVTVRRVLLALATYTDREEFCREYPELEEEDLQQALAFSAANLDDRVDLIKVT
jgi:uncharacterized protein (DUF433 family)